MKQPQDSPTPSVLFARDWGTGSLSAGVFSLYVVPPFTLIALWIASRHIAGLEASKVERARAAGEPV